MKFLKYVSPILIVCSLSSCNMHADNKTHVKVSKYHKAFDVLENTEGENSLDYEKHVQGKFMLGNDDKKPLNASSKFLNNANIDINYAETGYASFYAHSFHGRKTANGAIYDENEYTAAHRTLPMPSVVRVINRENQRSVLVVVTDRGPYKGGKSRIIDLSVKAAKELGIINKGVAKVKVQYLHEETKALLTRFPFEERTKANLAFQNALTKYVASVNAVRALPKNS